MRYATIVIVYTIYYLIQNNNVLKRAVYGVYQIIHDHATIDLRKWLQGQILENIFKIKREYNKHIMKYGGIMIFNVL